MKIREAGLTSVTSSQRDLQMAIITTDSMVDLFF